MEQMASASKRPRTPTSPPPDKKRRRSSDSSVRDNTLRIVTEMLREENRQLVQDREGLEKDKKSLSERLEQTQRSLRDLEDDVARVYCQKQKEMDAQRRAFEQKLKESAELQESKDIRSTVTFSQQTTKEMDRYVESCELWHKKLAVMSGELKTQMEKVETREIQGVVRDLVMDVEMKTMRNELKTTHELLLCQRQWNNWRYEDELVCLKNAYRDRQRMEEFEATERQLMNDRVVELETQLAQKRAVEKEKETELSSLRADQEKLLNSSHVLPNEEFETLVEEKKNMEEELKQMIVQMKKQAEELESVKERCMNLKQQNEKLLEETRQLREKQEKSELESRKHTKTQDEEIKKLQEQVQAGKNREAKMTAVLKSAGKEMEKSKQRKEELKILYAKFSSTMDSVSEKTMRLEELEQEMKDVQNNASDIQAQKENLEKQVAQLQQEKDDLSVAQLREKDDMSEELTNVQKKYTELRELESRQKELTDKMQDEITELKMQNKTLKLQQIKQEHQSVGQPSNEGGKRRVDSDSALVVKVAEEEALKLFIQRYYATAEEKCNRLLAKMRELESLNTSIQEPTE